jgi:hypothetical protein
LRGRKHLCTNFVIILNDSDEARALMTHTEFVEVAEHKKVVAFLDLSQRYGEIEDNLKMLTADNFVVVTT